MDRYTISRAKVLYLCDREKQCGALCGKDCRHTSDPVHAVNYTNGRQPDLDRDFNRIFESDGEFYFVEKDEEDFSPGSVPVAVAARAYGKSAEWVRYGIAAGWLPIGRAVRKGKLITSTDDIDCRRGNITYQISPKLLYEQTGYKWKGEKK